MNVDFNKHFFTDFHKHEFAHGNHIFVPQGMKIEDFIKNEKLFAPFQKDYEEVLDALLTFAKVNSNSIQPPLTEDSIDHIKATIETLKGRLFGTDDWFGPHKAFVYTVAKEMLHNVVANLNNEEIPIESRIKAITDFTDKATTCSGGILTGLSLATSELDRKGFLETTAKEKRKLIEATITEYVNSKHMVDESSEVHYRTIYINYMCSELGIPEQIDPFSGIASPDITEENKIECFRKVLDTVTPSRLAMILAGNCLSKVKENLANLKIDLEKNDYGYEIYQSVEPSITMLKEEYGELPILKSIILEKENCDNDRYMIAKEPTLLATHILKSLEKEELIKGSSDPVVLKELNNKEKIKCVGSLFFIEDNNGIRQEASIDIILQHVTPSLLINKYNNNDTYQRSLKELAESVLNASESGKLENKTISKWINNWEGIHPGPWTDAVLRLAAKCGNFEIIKKLQKKGVTIDIDGITPLMIAAKQGNLQLMESLINLGCDVNKLTQGGFSAASFAIQNKDQTAEILEILGKNGLDLNKSVDANERQMSDLLTELAIKYDNVKALEFLAKNSIELGEFSDEYEFSAGLLAAYYGSNNVLKYLIDFEISKVNETDEDHRSLLNLAAENGQVETINILIEKYGADINENVGGKMPLMSAASCGKVDVIKRLLELGANPYAEFSFFSKKDNTHIPLKAIDIAARHNQLEAIRILLQNGVKFPNINEYLPSGRTVAMNAALSGNLELLKELIKHGTGLNIKSSHSSNCASIVEFAIRGGNLNILNELINNGVNIDEPNSLGQTPLMIAIELGNPNMIKLLLEKGANINNDDHNEISVLMYAIKSGKHEILEILTNNEELEIDKLGTGGITALMYAANSGNLIAVKHLVKRKAKLENTTIDNGTALTMAAKAGYVGIVKYIIDEMKKENINSDIRIEESSSKNISDTKRKKLFKERNIISRKDWLQNELDKALMIAAETNNIKMVDLLIDKGAIINHEDSKEYTPAMRAALSGHAEVVKKLLKIQLKAAKNNGKEDVNKVINEGLRIATIAAAKGHANIIQVLPKKIQNELHTLEYPLPIIAAEYGHAEVLKVLIEKKVNVNAQNRDGITALICAAEEGHIDAVSVLINSKKVDINASIKTTGGSRKYTAALFAVENGHSEVLRILLDNGAEIDFNEARRITTSNDVRNVLNAAYRNKYGFFASLFNRFV